MPGMLLASLREITSDVLSANRILRVRSSSQVKATSLCGFLIVLRPGVVKEPQNFKHFEAKVFYPPYLIFVNFGTPPHYLGLYKVHQKVCKFATKQPIKIQNMQKQSKQAKKGQNLAFSILKVHQLKKSTPPSVVAVVTNMSYVELYPWYITLEKVLNKFERI